MSSRFKITPHKRTCFILLVFMLIHIAAGGLLGLIPDISSYLKTALSLFVSAACVSTLYISTSKTNIIRFFRIKKITFTEAVMWFFLGICANCSLTIINIPVSMLWEHFDIFPEGIGAPQSLLQYFFGIIMPRSAPALFEEILCRGIVLREYENYGKKAALFVSAAAFALLHRDITSLVMTFLLGLMLAYVVFMSDSIFPAMIFHFAVNFFSLTAGYISEHVILRICCPFFAGAQSRHSASGAYVRTRRRYCFGKPCGNLPEVRRRPPISAEVWLQHITAGHYLHIRLHTGGLFPALIDRYFPR